MSDPPPLARAAAVVRLRGYVLDAGHLEPCCLKRADRGLAAGAGALDEDLHLLEAVLDALARGRVGGHLRGKRSRLARALETGTAGGLPGDHVALAIGERNDRVVERSLDVGLADRDVLADPAAAALRPTRSGAHGLLLTCLLLPGHLHALGALARARIVLGVLAVHRKTAPVAHAAVAADLLQALDVLRALASQVTLDDDGVVDEVAQLHDLFLGEIADLAIRLDPDLGQQPVGGRTTDPVDVGQADLDTLVEGDVDP